VEPIRAVADAQITLAGAGRITGSVFEDINANGLRDTGEPLVAGRTIFLDSNGNGVPDLGELTSVTATDGSYVFSGLVAGQYLLRENTPSHWVETAPAIQVQALTLSGGQAIQNINFGSVHITLDVDLNERADALSDGLVIVRHLFGFTGNALINGVVDPAGLRTDASAITRYLTLALPSMLDPDGNGRADALTDGLAIVRYMFGFTGNALTGGVVDPAGARHTADAVKAFLDGFNPALVSSVQTQAVTTESAGASTTDSTTTNQTTMSSSTPIVDMSNQTAAPLTTDNKSASMDSLSLAFVQQSWVQDFVTADPIASTTSAEEEELLIALPA
jgi:hypothetical protein